MSASRVTIRDVAGEARLSRTTVSMALRNHPLISQATREHVKQVADRMGYRPVTSAFPSGHSP